MPISSLNSFIFLLSSLHILRSQLFSAICIFSCLSASASVPNPYIQADTTQASNTFPFSCFFSFLFHIMPSTLLHAAALGCILLCISLLLPPSSHTVHLFNGLSVNNYMQVPLLFAYPHYFCLLQIHSEAMFSKGIIGLPSTYACQYIEFVCVSGVSRISQRGGQS